MCTRLNFIFKTFILKEKHMSSMNVSTSQINYFTGTLRQLAGQKQPRPLHLTERELTRIGVDSEISQLQSCVPRIRHGYNGQPQGGGSAFVISSDGFLLTADHVVRLIDGDALFADFPLVEGLNYPVKITPEEVDKEINEPKPNRKIKVFPMPVKIVARSPHDDLALLAIALPESEDPWRYVELSSKTPQKSEPVFKIGHSEFERHNILTTGQVVSSQMFFETEYDGLREKLKRFFTETWERSLKFYPRFGATLSSNKVNGGDSGGLLCDNSGRACGVLHGRVPRWLVATKNIINNISGGKLLGPNIRTSHESISINLEDRVIPFLRGLGVNPDSLMQGKPIRLSNVIEKIFKRKV